MWIKEPNEKLTESLHENVNFLYFDETKIYVMDNHLCAAWCWLKLIDVEKSYNFIHIDRHYDLLDLPDTIKTEIIDKGITIQNLNFPEFLALKQIGPSNEQWQMFRWDNYILNLRLAYPDLFNETYFATHRDGNIREDFVDREVEFLELISEIDYWIERDNKNGWIVNLDIDYFFHYVNGNLIQLFSDDVIKSLARNIAKVLKRIDVLTIALSPECCGGWDESFRVMKMICEILEISFMEEIGK